MERLQQQAEQRVAAVAEADLATALPPEDGDRALADELARRHDLDVLELIDAEGRVVSSHHWPAGFGLADRDAPVRRRPATASSAPPRATARATAWPSPPRARPPGAACP